MTKSGFNSEFCSKGVKYLVKKFEEGQLQTSTCMWNSMIISLLKLANS